MRAAVLPIPGRRFVKVTEFIPMAVAARRIGIDPYFTVDVVLCGQYDALGLLLDTELPLAFEATSHRNGIGYLREYIFDDDLRPPEIDELDDPGGWYANPVPFKLIYAN